MKIGDFGLARICRSTDMNEQEEVPQGKPRDKGDMTNQVATRWYKSPELLWGSKRYNSSVDIWAIGCIFGELLQMSPLFRGENDIDQLNKIILLLGNPSASTWPVFLLFTTLIQQEMETLPDFDKITFESVKPKELTEVFPNVSNSALELLKKFLQLNPSNRIAARDALVDRFFFSEPIPSPAHVLVKELPFIISEKVKTKQN